MISGQNPTLTKPAVMVQKIKEDGLIIVIPSDKKKTDEIQRLIDSDEVKEKTKANLRKKLASALRRTELTARSIDAWFDSIYHFSPAYTCYDYQLKNVQNDTLQLIDNLNDQPFLILKNTATFLVNGRIKHSTSTGIESWIFRDRNMEAIPRPFPNSVSLRSIKMFFRGLFLNEEKEIDKNSEDLATKAQGHLVEYFLKTNF